MGTIIRNRILKSNRSSRLSTRNIQSKNTKLRNKISIQNIIREWFNDKVIGNNLNTILKDLVTLNLEEFEEKFKQLVIEMFSFMDVGKTQQKTFIMHLY